MNTYELIAPCHFGLESVLKKEIYELGYEIISVEDGKVTFEGDAEAICRANINLRTAERVLLKVGQFNAVTFTELFDQTKELPWEEFIPADGKFWVTKANSVNSKLFSSSDIQSIVKKAIVERLKLKYRINWFKEDGEGMEREKVQEIMENIKNEEQSDSDSTGIGLENVNKRLELYYKKENLFKIDSDGAMCGTTATIIIPKEEEVF